MLRTITLAILLATTPVFAADFTLTGAPNATSIAARAINTLGIELLARAAKPNQNALLSPYSIQSALAMTYAGADGVTRAEMAKALKAEAELRSFWRRQLRAKTRGGYRVINLCAIEHCGT